MYGQNQKAAFRINQRVTCDYYPGTVFKVVAKEWDINGTLFYTIQRNIGTDKFDNFAPIGGLRQKYLKKDTKNA